MVEAVTLYPASWYYNACVYGFLKVLAYGLEEEYVENNVLQKDGTVLLAPELMTALFTTPEEETSPKVPIKENRHPPLGDIKRLAWWWVEMNREIITWEKDELPSDLPPDEVIEKVCSRIIVGKSTIKTRHRALKNYTNLCDRNWNKKSFLNMWFSPNKGKGPEKCSFCGQLISQSEDAFEQRPYNRFFLSVLSDDLASSTGKFPNSFWDLKPNLLLCPLCRSIFLCAHFTIVQVLFANTSNFQLTWHFNKFLAKSQRNFFHATRNYQEELFYHFLHFNNQMSRSMGAWELQGLEFLNFTGEGIEHYVLPPIVCNLLLSPIASSLLARIKNRTVLKYVLEERFELLPNISYKSLRVALGAAPENSKDPEAGLLLPEIINLCRLYPEVKKMLERRREFIVVKTEEVLRCGQEAPAALAKEGSSLIYRLLELVRLGKKDEAYYLLLRSYIAENRPFPPVLTKVFRLQNVNLFKNFMFSYIAGVQSNAEGGEI
ncbi:hypothetical protein Desku_0602 [Desulfofundulus kuznetsovii DSM 6115]|uniref:Type I-B CRISPR-associated protein Cas8b1/Cst1 n=1 Tax=Desulfofundulus kuznetsovii (strain DSM 6115 / VKM B-1805 / 17) TaxID=760568 RepID=A0AAU8PU24_DESK7|nr:hypothetical protein Desku_0602 [Desulfofundulus kuznetsovii DSM 6115]